MAKALEVLGVSATTPLNECARRIIVARMTEMMSFKSGSIDGEDAEFVHDIRVASRRLRAAMQNFAACFPKDEFRKHLRRVESVTRTVGAVRDLDVLIKRFETDVEGLSEDEQGGVRRLLQDLRVRRDKARQPMLALFAKLERKQFEAKFTRFFEA